MRFSRIVSTLIQNRLFRVILVISIFSGLSFMIITRTLNLGASITNTLTYGMIGQPYRINPLWKSLNQTDEALTKIIYRPLIKFDETNRPVGDLADRWEISEDGKTYTVFLKTNLIWQDNETIDADDVIFTYQTTQKPEYQGPEKQRFQNVLIEKNDHYSIKFVLNDPFAPFLESLSLEILPQHIWQNLSLAEMIASKYNLNPVGSSTFKIVDVGLNTSIDPVQVTKMVINNINPSESNTNLRRIVISFYENEKQLTTAYNIGEIDLFSSKIQDLIHPYENWENSIVTAQEICGQTLTIFYRIDSTQNTLYNDSDFQIALRSAIENSDIYSKPFNSLISPRSWAYNDQLVFEPYPDEKIREVLGSHTPVTLTTQDNEIAELVAQDLVSLLQNYNFTLNLETVSNTQLKDEILPERKFELLLALQKIAYDPDQYAFWHSSQTNIANGGLNISNYVNRQADKSLEDGRTTSNEDLRKAAYLTLQSRLFTDRPALFLKHPPLYEVSRLNVDPLPFSEDNPNACVWYETDYLSNRLGIQ